MSETYRIPGFVTPDAPKTRDHVEASPSGQVFFDIDETSLQEPIPAYRMKIVQEFGGSHVLFYEDVYQTFIFSQVVPTNLSCKRVYCYISPLDLELAAGSYRIEFTLDGTIMHSKWLAVPARIRQNAMTSQSSKPVVPTDIS